MVVEPIEGLVIDSDAEHVWLCGTLMPVGSLMRTPYDPGGSIVLETDFPEVIRPMARQLNLIGRTRPVVEEAIHFTVLCGENGWWLELGAYPGFHGFRPGLTVDVPGEPHDPSDVTARQALARWVDTCHRLDAPPDDEGGPFCGLEPGRWLW